MWNSAYRRSTFSTVAQFADPNNLTLDFNSQGPPTTCSTARPEPSGQITSVNGYNINNDNFFSDNVGTGFARQYQIRAQSNFEFKRTNHRFVALASGWLSGFGVQGRCLLRRVQSSSLSSSRAAGRKGGIVISNSDGSFLPTLAGKLNP